MKQIRLTPEPGKVLVNIQTLHYVTWNVYTTPDLQKNWIQVDRCKLKQFIAEAKAQKEATATTVTE